MKYSGLMLIVLLVSINSFAQRKKIDPKIISLTNEMKEKYEDNNYYYLSSSQKFTFELNEKTKLVEVSQFEDERVASLKETNNSFFNSIFYNDLSEVDDFKVTNYKGRYRSSMLMDKKFKSSGIFYDDVKIKYFNIPFTQIADNIGYTYVKKTEDIKYVTKTFFHTNAPIISKKIVFRVPNWLKLELLEMNFEGFDIVKESKKEGEETVITYTMDNLKPVQNKKLGSSYSTSLPHILILAKEFKDGASAVSILNSTQDLYNWYHNLTTEVNNKTSDFEPQVKELTTGVADKEQQVKNIFYWVQDNIRYIAYEDGIMGFKPATAQEVYNNKFGDCKGMANLTCEMLKSAGFDARLTWIGTRSIPYNYNTPCFAVDNHMITTLYLNGKPYYLDATEKGVQFGEYAHRIQGQDVMIEDGNDFIIDTIPDASYDKNGVVTKINLVFEGQILSGKGTEKYKGEERKNLYSAMKDVTNKDFEKFINRVVFSGNKNIELVNYTGDKAEQREDKIEFDFELNLLNQITEVGNELYMNTDYDKSFSSLEVDKDRVNDLDFKRKININKETRIKMPAGFSVDYLPELVDVTDEEFSMKLSYIHDKTRNELVYRKQIVVNNGQVKAEKIEKWNQGIKELNEFYNNQII
ncbi:MAG: transglutaminase domain-containing protein, partial [Flavobacteriales bacterium]